MKRFAKFRRRLSAFATFVMFFMVGVALGAMVLGKWPTPRTVAAFLVAMFVAAATFVEPDGET